MRARFDYARAEHETIITELGAVFRSADLALMLESNVPMERTEQGVRAAFVLHAGDSSPSRWRSATPTRSRA